MALPLSQLQIFRISGLTALLAMMTACGSTTLPSVNGTWTFSAISLVVPSEPPQKLTGTLTSSGSSVQASLSFTDACLKGQTLAYTGSISSASVLKLTSATYANQIVTLNGTLSSDGSLLTLGTYTVTADNSSQPICSNGDNGVLTGNRDSTAQ